MSNQVNIVPTKCNNMRTGTISYGLRIYDEYYCIYSNHWRKGQIPDDDLELLQFCLNDDVSFNEVASDMFEYVAEEQIGLYIGEEWYEWDQVKHLFEDNNSNLKR